MITKRPSAARGHAQHGWLESRHTFSFADYYDPSQMGFSNLRVINEDRVAPGRGFGTHSHRDMEIISYVLEGSLEHKDSIGTGSVIRPGDVQRMSAGSGVAHSEFNASKIEPVHFLQIWLLPSARGTAPSYEQKTFGPEEKRARLRVVASPDGRDGSVTVHADAVLHAGLFETAERANFALTAKRQAWVQVARGQVMLNGELFSEGDGAAVTQEAEITIEGVDSSEVLVFDLP